MRLRYPLSFPQLLLTGLALMALVPALMLWVAYFSFLHLGQRSEDAIARATQVTRASRALGEQLTALERLARQQLVLYDEPGLAAYERQRERLAEAVTVLSRHAGALAISDELSALQRAEREAWQQLQRTPGGAAPTPQQGSVLLETFTRMNASAAVIVREADRRIEADTDSLLAESARARGRLLWQLLALVPLCLLLAAALSWLIRRPVRQIEAGILALGEAKFDTPVVVDGPRDLHRLGGRLEWLRHRLIALNAQQTRFLHHVSHELKTPLTALHEGIALLQDKVTGPLNTAQGEVVGILVTNCQRLRKLIENLLDYSGLRARAMVLQREPVLLDALIARVVEDHKLAAAARQITIVCEGPAMQLEAHADGLRVVLDNLLSNALKYAPVDSHVTVRTASEGGLAHIEIVDAGPGIPAGQVAQMFEPFVQGPAPQGGVVKGSGLGLSIVREIVDAHGGEVVLLPVIGGGTCARVSLPLQAGREK